MTSILAWVNLTVEHLVDGIISMIQILLSTDLVENLETQLISINSRSFPSFCFDVRSRNRTQKNVKCMYV